jgi:hypothetical protein
MSAWALLSMFDRIPLSDADPVLSAIWADDAGEQIIPLLCKLPFECRGLI